MLTESSVSLCYERLVWKWKQRRTPQKYESYLSLFFCCKGKEVDCQDFCNSIINNWFTACARCLSSVRSCLCSKTVKNGKNCMKDVSAVQYVLFCCITAATRCVSPLMQQPCREKMKALCCSTLPPCLHLLAIPPIHPTTPPGAHWGGREIKRKKGEDSAERGEWRKKGGGGGWDEGDEILA